MREQLTHAYPIVQLGSDIQNLIAGDVIRPDERAIMRRDHGYVAEFPAAKFRVAIATLCVRGLYR
jgi:hypothetical protein